MRSLKQNVLFAISKTVCLLFVVAACVAFPEAREMLNGEAFLEGNTFYLPLVLCKPGDSVQFDGSRLSYDVTDSECRTLDFVVNASAASLLMSVFAVLTYILSDVASTIFDRGPFNNNTLLGMGLFLVLILIQCAVTGWALAKEALWTADVVSDVLKNLDEDLGIDVQPRGNMRLLQLSGAIAVFSSCFIFLDPFARGERSQKKEGAAASSSATFGKSWSSGTEDFQSKHTEMTAPRVTVNI